MGVVSSAEASEGTRGQLDDIRAAANRHVRGVLAELLDRDDILDAEALRGAGAVLEAAANVAETVNGAMGVRVVGGQPAPVGRPEGVGPGGAGRSVALRVAGQDACELLPPHDPAAVSA
jgi:hypothetical protein